MFAETLLGNELGSKDLALSFKNPLGNGALGQLLGGNLIPGQQASVLDTENLHKGHVDAKFFEKLPTGRVSELNGFRQHLDPNSLTPKK